MEPFAKETIPVSLEAEMRHSYLDYAMSVIVGRALPDARDGLKPVHRRVLFAMHELTNDWNRPYKKSARIVDGDIAAAMRYTEIRLAKIAHEMLADLDKETVNFGPNYDGSEQEPLVMPS